MTTLESQIEQRLWEWSCRTEGHTSLRLSGLQITDLSAVRIPEGVHGLKLSSTLITDQDYPARLPFGILTLEHHFFMGTTLEGLDTTRIESLSLQSCPFLTTLGPLPPTLRKLTISGCPNLTSLPSLPKRLYWLDVMKCPALTVIPPLPSGFTTLLASDSGLLRCPVLPPVIQVVHVPPTCLDCRVIDFTATLAAQRHPWGIPTMKSGIDLLLNFQRNQTRMALLKEELMMAAWHPTRVSKWLLHGEEVLDMMMGC